MRQPKRHFIHRTGTAIYLDAMLSGLRKCRGGCDRDPKYMCIHRFGRDVYVIAQQERAAFLRLTDLQVILDFLFVINQRWNNGLTGVWNRRHVILTDDRRFVQSAEYAYRHEQNMRQLSLHFRPNGVTYEVRGYPWEIDIEVHLISQDRIAPQELLRAAIRYTRTHLIY